MALTKIFVDPAVGYGSGSGADSNPYGSVKYAIEQEGWDSGNGMQFNIKLGTDEVLTEDLAVTLSAQSYSPSEGAPLQFRGFALDPEDGGIGGISGGGSVAIINDSAMDHVSFIDLHLHSCGSATIITLDDWCEVSNCEIDNCTGNALQLNQNAIVLKNHIHNIAGIGVSGTDRSSFIAHNRFENGANKFTAAISPGTSGGGIAYRNRIKIDGASDGIRALESFLVVQNSIWSDGGTGSGITGQTNHITGAIINNLIEGFSGSGGIGINLGGTGMGVRLYGANSVFNCETDFVDPARYALYDLAGNESLSESPFRDAANDDFSTIKVGNVKEGSLPAVIGQS